MKKIKAWLFVHLVRPLMRDGETGELRKCPCCGELLQFYPSHGWLHMVDGDADCFGALSYGKGRRDAA